MLKCLEQLDAWARETYGASLDRENSDPDFGNCMVYLEAPVGYVWEAFGDRTIIEIAATDCGSRWTDACAEVKRYAEQGIRVATPEEQRDIEHDFGLRDGTYRPGNQLIKTGDTK